VSLSRREANVFACLADTVIAPGGPLPALGRTDTVAFLDAYLDTVPRINRAGVRALLLALELGPLPLGYGARLRRLEPDRRLAYLDRLDRGPAHPAVQAVEAMAKLAYYGDTGVMGTLGYDPDAVVARGRALRAQEGRW
jgi:hypothetical protein